MILFASLTFWEKLLLVVNPFIFISEIICCVAEFRM